MAQYATIRDVVPNCPPVSGPSRHVQQARLADRNAGGFSPARNAARWQQKAQPSDSGTFIKSWHKDDRRWRNAANLAS